MSRNIRDRLAVFRQYNRCLVRPFKRYRAVRNPTVLHADKFPFGEFLLITCLCRYRVDTRSKLVRNNDFVLSRRSERIVKSFRRNKMSVIVPFQKFPRFATVNRLENFQSLQTRFLVYTLGYGDFKFFTFGIFRDSNLRRITGNNHREYFRFAKMVNRFHGVRAAFFNRVRIFKIEIPDHFAVLVEYRKHSQFVVFIDNGNAHLVFE